ncbi:MAG: bacteriohemerythrin [Sulfuriflexus sp.]|nr:bacteriohemerythrin [Sulfuriflexus sp.]
MYIHWDKKYETGQPLMDAEHRLLVLLFKKLDVAIKTKRSEKVLTRIVSEVRKFVDFHFKSEENLMLETGYPNYEEHQKIHTNLMIELNANISRVVSHKEYPDDLLYFLHHWLIEHIAKHIRSARSRPVAEQNYKDFLRS